MLAEYSDASDGAGESAVTAVESVPSAAPDTGGSLGARERGMARSGRNGAQSETRENSRLESALGDEELGKFGLGDDLGLGVVAAGVAGVVRVLGDVRGLGRRDGEALRARARFGLTELGRERVAGRRFAAGAVGGVQAVSG